MAPLVPDELWEIAEPNLPRVEKNPRGGPTPVSNRQALTGILFVPKSGVPWSMLPREMGCGSGVTCWRRFAAWAREGVWRKLHEATLDRLGRAGGIAWWYAVIDSASVRALKGGRTPGPARSTAANAAVSGTCSPTPAARPWPCTPRRPTRETTRRRRGSWRASRPSKARVGGRAASPTP